MGFFRKKKRSDYNPDGSLVDLSAEIRRLRAENENLRLQLQQHWEIIYQYEKQMTERRRHRHRRAPTQAPPRGDKRDQRIRELEQDNKILAKYVINTNQK